MAPVAANGEQRAKAVARIRDIWNLTSSRHAEEADAARGLALGLMERYGITPRELGRTYGTPPSNEDLVEYRSAHGLPLRDTSSADTIAEELKGRGDHYEFFWRTSAGATLKVSEMEVSHLVNAVRWIRKRTHTSRRAYFEEALQAMLTELRTRGVGDPDLGYLSVTVTRGSGTHARKGHKLLEGGGEDD